MFKKIKHIFQGISTNNNKTDISNNSCCSNDDSYDNYDELENKKNNLNAFESGNSLSENLFLGKDDNYIGGYHLGNHNFDHDNNLVDSNYLNDTRSNSNFIDDLDYNTGFLNPSLSSIDDDDDYNYSNSNYNTHNDYFSNDDYYYNNSYDDDNSDYFGGNSWDNDSF